MILERLVVKDIGPFRKLNYCFSKATSKVVFIKGLNHDKGFDSNGSGKSMLFDIITWVLYDETYRGVSKDKMLRIDRKDGIVKSGYAIFYFKLVSDGETYWVKRTRGTTNSVRYGTLTGTKRKHAKTSHRTADINKKIIELVGLDYDLFCSIAYLGAGQENFLSCTPGKRLNLFSSLMGSGLKETNDVVEDVKRRWTEYSNKAKELRSQMQVYTEEISAVDGRNLNKRKKIILSKIKKTEKAIKQLDIQISFFDRKRALDNEYRNLKISYDDWKETSKIVISKISKIKSEIVKLKRGRIVIDDKVVKLEETVKKRPSAVNRVRIRNDALKSLISTKNGLETIIEQLQSKVKHLNGVLSGGIDVCPYCFSDLGDDISVKRLKEEKKESLLKLEKAKKDLFVISKDISTAKALSRKANDIIVKIDKSIMELKTLKIKRQEKTSLIVISRMQIKEREEEKLRINRLEAEAKDGLKTLRAKRKKLAEKISLLDHGVDLLSEKRQVLFDLKSNFDIGLGEVLSTIKKVKRFSKLAKEKENELTEINRSIMIAQWCLFNIPKIKAMIIDSIKNEFENKTNEYLTEIFPDVMIEYDIIVGDAKREKFDIFIIEKSNGVKKIYEQESGGERKRVTLAVILALNWLASSLNNILLGFLFLDEIFGNVDVTGCKSVFDLLLAEKGNRDLYVATHMQDVERYGDVITVVKKNGESYVEVA